MLEIEGGPWLSSCADRGEASAVKWIKTVSSTNLSSSSTNRFNQGCGDDIVSMQLARYEKPKIKISKNDTWTVELSYTYSYLS